MIFVDNRESPKVIKEFEKQFQRGVDFVVATLLIGDIILTEKSICIERKSALDFIASIKSGHLKKQLLQQEDAFDYSYLIIVGDPLEKAYWAKQQWTTNQQIGALASLSVRFKTKILQVKNIASMVKLVKAIFEKTDDGRKVNLKDTDLLTNHITTDDMHLKILTCFKGIGIKTAEKLKEKKEVEKVLIELNEIIKECQTKK